MSGIQKTNFIIPGPRKYVQDSLATIGVQSRTYGTMSHALQVSYVLSHDAYDAIC